MRPITAVTWDPPRDWVVTRCGEGLRDLDTVAWRWDVDREALAELDDAGCHHDDRCLAEGAVPSAAAAWAPAGATELAGTARLDVLPAPPWGARTLEAQLAAAHDEPTVRLPRIVGRIDQLVEPAVLPAGEAVNTVIDFRIRFPERAYARSWEWLILPPGTDGVVQLAVSTASRQWATRLGDIAAGLARSVTVTLADA